MIRRALATLTFIASLLSPAAAQERVTVGTMRLTSNSALFLAVERGYFKAEGLDIDMTAYKSETDVAAGVASGATDFGLGAFTPTAFNYAGRGLMKAVAAQVREKRSYEGNEIIVSNAAYNRGLRKPENLVSSVVAIGELGSLPHYQIGQVARIKNFDFATITVKPQPSVDAMAIAVSAGKVDAAILPGKYARDLMALNEGKLVAWYSDLDEQQLGALFVSAKTLQARRPAVEKFLRAYRRAAAEYSAIFMRHDPAGKRISSVKSREAAAIIARYVYPGRPVGNAATAVEIEALYMDPHARLDAADITRQVTWYQAQGLVDKAIDPNSVMDLSFK